jgi:hypothetical protein
MTWDIVMAKFFGENPFDFKHGNQIMSNLAWREVQKRLDHIKSGQHKDFMG